MDRKPDRLPPALQRLRAGASPRPPAPRDTRVGFAIHGDDEPDVSRWLEQARLHRPVPTTKPQPAPAATVRPAPAVLPQTAPAVLPQIEPAVLPQTAPAVLPQTAPVPQPAALPQPTAAVVRPGLAAPSSPANPFVSRPAPPAPPTTEPAARAASPARTPRAPTSRRPRLWWLLAAPALGGLTVTAAVAGLRARPTGDAPPGSLRALAPAMAAGATTAGPPRRTIRGIGKVDFRHHAQLRSRIAGVIEAVEVSEGQDVSAGEVLLRLDPSDTQRALQRAQAEVALREAAVRQATRTRSAAVSAPGKDGAASHARVRANDELNLAEARLKVALAARRAALDQLRYTKVVAPFAGRITARHAQPGETVLAGTTSTEGPPLLVLTNLDEPFVRLPLSPAELARTVVGQSAKVALGGDAEQPLQGRVIALTTGAVNVAFEAAPALSPGLDARVAIEPTGEVALQAALEERPAAAAP